MNGNATMLKCVNATMFFSLSHCSIITLTHYYSFILSFKIHSLKKGTRMVMTMEKTGRLCRATASPKVSMATS